MTKKKKTKRLSKRQLKQKQQLYKNTVISILLCLLVVSISYIIFITDFLKPRVNEVTASYISFNNKDTTDMIKINNLKKMSNDIGKSIVNTKYSQLVVRGENNSNYQVVVYPIINNIDLKYINYAISVDNNIYMDNLDTEKLTDDEGIVIYSGVVTEEKKITIRMWVSKEYEGEIENNSFNIKINPR